MNQDHPPSAPLLTRPQLVVSPSGRKLRWHYLGGFAHHRYRQAGSARPIPGLPQPLRLLAQGRNHPLAHGHPRHVPLPISTAPACSSFLGWESLHMAAWRQHLQPSHITMAATWWCTRMLRHHLPKPPQWVLPDSQPAHGESTPQSSDTKVGCPAFRAPKGSLSPLTHRAVTTPQQHGFKGTLTIPSWLKYLLQTSVTGRFSLVV